MSQAQGTVQNTAANEAGVYQFSFLQPGKYDIEISVPGFKTLTLTDLKWAVAENARMDFNLELRTVPENVNVSAAAAAVNTE